LSTTTDDGQDIKVSGTVKFTMILTCDEFTDPAGQKWPGGTVQFFHEKIGSKDQAYNTEGGKGYGDGWRAMLRQYMGFAVDRVIDDNALKYTQDQLRTDETAKADWEDAVKETLPRTLKSMTLGVEIFRVNDVLLQRPGVREEIANANAEKQAATIRAQAVNIDKEAAKDFPGGIRAYQAYQQQQAINEAIKNGKVKVMPIPQGSGIIVQGAG
jgi:hypothetical protein